MGETLAADEQHLPLVGKDSCCVTAMDRGAKTVLISVVPNLTSEAGHYFQYHVSVGKAGEVLGWQHEVLLPKEHALTKIPRGWRPLLGRESPARKPRGLRWISKIIGAFRTGLSSVYHLHRRYRSYGDKIVLFEGWTDLQLLVWAFAMFLWRPRRIRKIWIFFRTDIFKRKLRLLAGKAGNSLLVAGFPGDTVQLLTDSVVLGAALSRHLRRTLHVMPIPHGHASFHRSAGAIHKRRGDPIIVWWPGPPRPEKGLNILRRLVGITGSQAQGLIVVVARGSALSEIEGGASIQKTDDVLERAAYLRQLESTDVVLLPYDREQYHYRTSGIFAECIGAGKIPAVTEGTWMATELRRYGLSKLILDWERDDLFSCLRNVAEDRDIWEKLARMQKDYMETHSEKGFASRMQALHG